MWRIKAASTNHPCGTAGHTTMNPAFEQTSYLLHFSSLALEGTPAPRLRTRSPPWNEEHAYRSTQQVALWCNVSSIPLCQMKLPDSNFILGSGEAPSSLSLPGARTGSCSRLGGRQNSHKRSSSSSPPLPLNLAASNFIYLFFAPFNAFRDCSYIALIWHKPVWVRLLWLIHAATVWPHYKKGFPEPSTYTLTA